MGSAIVKTTIREIKGSVGRYLAILAIVMLGVGLFAGLTITKPAMIATENNYLREQNFFDFQLLSTVGFTQEDVEELAAMEGIADAEGTISVDALCAVDDTSEAVYKVFSVPEQINRLVVTAGRLPEAVDECVLDAGQYGEDAIGSQVVITDTNAEDTLEMFANRTYTVVGIVQSPSYINFERGTASIGDGKIAAFLCIPEEAFDCDYLTGIYLTTNERYDVYSDEYEDYIESMQDGMEEKAEELAWARYNRLLSDAQEEIEEAQDELDEKKAEAEEELAKAAEEIEDGEQDLRDGEQELIDGEKEIADYEKELADGAEKIRDGEREIPDKEKEIADADKEIALHEWEIFSGEQEIGQGWYLLEQAKDTLREKENELLAAEEELRQGEKEIAKNQTELNEKETELNAQEAMLNEKEAELSAQEAELNAKEAELNAQEEELNAQETALALQEAALEEESRKLEQEQTELLTMKDTLSVEEYEQKMAKIQQAKAQLQAVKEQLQAGKAQIQEGKAQIQAGKAQLQAGKAQIQAGKAQLQEGKEQIQAGKEQIQAGKAQLQAALAQLQDGKNQIQVGKAQIQAGKEEIAVQETLLKNSESQLASGKSEVTKARAELEEGKAALEDGKKELADSKEELAKAQKELADARQELEDGKIEIEDGRVELADARKEYEEARAEFDEEVADAQKKIDDAREELEELEEPDQYVLTRNSNIGYACYDSDASIIAAIANIFPAFFFLVAALICMTTMNRMVEEQRTQIGVLKAMGYGNGAIMGKFLFYAGSAAFVGAVAGCVGGTWLFPKVIWEGYSIMYNMGGIEYVFDFRIALLSIAAALLCSMGAAYFSCRYELYSVPANLIRPKAPKNGKRIFLEKITFLWSRMKFLHKVSARNIIRYKKRFFMMILGISGCTALLLTGFGIKDSVTNVADMQYDEIQIYDIGVTFSDAQTDADMAKLAEESKEILTEISYQHEESVDIDFGGKTKSVNLEIPQDAETMSIFLNLHTESGEPISYPQEGKAVLTARIAEDMGIKVGDNVTLRDNEMNQLTVEVTALCENFVYNYIYLNRETYENQMGMEPEYKSAYVDVKEGVDVHEAAAALADKKSVLAVSVTADMRARIANMMESMDYIVLLIIACAGSLAFIVLYNLTNINITERIREIATIKVLGFYAKETADYVFRENMALTALGAVVGLLLGKWLHWLVMYYVRIDMLSFKTLVRPISYLWSLLLTFCFAVFVDIAMYRKLERINMAESLKSIE
ncbi:MAG: FtsX-like permease family protein [Blautia sp.]|nr:FtsX-like permease family protein [Lachnoclostridium sp.]MCM1211733.1 FtsX-like permease family protein [Blautia sp.]